MATSIRPVGPGSTSGDGLDALLDELRSAMMELQNPQGPVLAWAVLEADLPPAANHTNEVALVTDIPTLAYSDGTNWLNAADGSVIV